MDSKPYIIFVKRFLPQVTVKQSIFNLVIYRKTQKRIKYKMSIRLYSLKGISKNLKRCPKETNKELQIKYELNKTKLISFKGKYNQNNTLVMDTTLRDGRHFYGGENDEFGTSAGSRYI